jgi:hypothetical protein
MRADLIAVDGDPLREIEVFEDPATVVLVTRDGAVFKDRIGTGESLLRRHLNDRRNAVGEPLWIRRE